MESFYSISYFSVLGRRWWNNVACLPCGFVDVSAGDIKCILLQYQFNVQTISSVQCNLRNSQASTTILYHNKKPHLEEDCPKLEEKTWFFYLHNNHNSSSSLLNRSHQETECWKQIHVGRVSEGKRAKLV